MGTHKEGCGGLQEQIPYQGLGPQCESRNDFPGFDGILTLE